jgi:hypothetical protein
VMVQWLQPDQALELRAGNLDLLIVERDDGKVLIDVGKNRFEVDVVEPLVEVDGTGGFAIVLEARVAEAVGS